MSEALGIALIIGWVSTTGGFLYLFHLLDVANKKQDDLLLERIQRPEFRPIALDEMPEPEAIERSDLNEMAAVGMINPSIQRDNGGS